MKTFGTVLLVVALLMLAVCFGAEMYVDNNLADNLLIREISPETMEWMLEVSANAGALEPMMERPIELLLLHTYAHSPMINRVAMGTLIAGGLLAALGKLLELLKRPAKA